MSLKNLLVTLAFLLAISAATATAHLHAHTRHEYFFTGAYLVRNEAAEQTLETFVAKIEETAYGNDARFLLGQLRFATRDYEAARLQFERLAKTPDFALAASAKKYLAMIQKRQ